MIPPFFIFSYQFLEAISKILHDFILKEHSQIIVIQDKENGSRIHVIQRDAFGFRRCAPQEICMHILRWNCL